MLKFTRLDNSDRLLGEDPVEEIYVEWDLMKRIMGTGRKWSTS